jgi:hypothetical protein
VSAVATIVAGEQTLRRHLSVADGFVLYTSAVLGQSLIVLPSIAARHAGPWSILIWAGLAAVSYPLARMMAEVGARYPSAGGVITFIGHGLGRYAGWLTGILYLAAIAVGGPATAPIFSEYLSRLVPLPGRWPIVVAALELGVLVAGNCFDVSRVMRLQRWVFLGCLAAITAALLLALPHGSGARLTDLHAYTLADVASTGLICFFAFVGWENAAFSGAAGVRRAYSALGRGRRDALGTVAHAALRRDDGPGGECVGGASGVGATGAVSARIESGRGCVCTAAAGAHQLIRRYAGGLPRPAAVTVAVGRGAALAGAQHGPALRKTERQAGYGPEVVRLCAAISHKGTGRAY